MIIKIIPLFAPLLIYFFIKLGKAYISSKFKKNDQKSDLMMSCHACKTYVHESLVIQNKGLYFCSKECANL